MSLGECIEKGCIAKGWLVLIYLAIIVLINLLLGRGRRKRKDLVCLLRSYVFSFKGILDGILILMTLIIGGTRIAAGSTLNYFILELVSFFLKYFQNNFHNYDFLLYQFNCNCLIW